MQQWARIAILGAMFVVAYLLILAWQKDYGNAETQPQQQAAVVSHEVSADLPNGQTATAASDVPQANISAQQTQTTDATAPVSQQLISVQTDLYHLWINPKGGDIVRVELLNHDKNKDSDAPFVMLESGTSETAEQPFGYCCCQEKSASCTRKKSSKTTCSRKFSPASTAIGCTGYCGDAQNGD